MTNATQTYLVTGGGSGIGLATAAALLRGGADVVIAGRDRERLSSAVKTLDAGERVLAVPTDVGSIADLDALAATIAEASGRLDGVFANAGTAMFGRTEDVDEATFDTLVSTIFKGTFFTVQKTLPLLADGGSVVLNGSWLAHRGMAFTSVYGAAKAAVAQLTRSLAADVAPRGIRVNAVSPGYVFTEMFTAISTTEQEWDAARSQVPLGRLASADDIADTVVHLLTGGSPYVTGQELLVDGGLIRSIAL